MILTKTKNITKTKIHGDYIAVVQNEDCKGRNALAILQREPVGRRKGLKFILLRDRIDKLVKYLFYSCI